MRTISKLLIAMMLAAGASSLALAPAVAQEKKTAAKPGSSGQLDPADCKAAAPGDKSKPREKVAAGTAQPGGELNPADCKAAPAAKSDKTRTQVRKETAAASKEGKIKHGETEAKKK